MSRTARVVLGGLAFFAGLIGFSMYTMVTGLFMAHVSQASGTEAVDDLKHIVLIDNFRALEGVESYRVFQFQDGVEWYRFNCTRSDFEAIVTVLQLSDTANVSLVNGQPVTYGYQTVFNGVPQDWGITDTLSMEYSGHVPPWWRPEELEGAILYRTSSCNLLWLPSKCQCWLESVNT